MTATPVLRSLVIDGPARVPTQFGLFSVVTPREPNDPHWQGGGVQWEVDSCEPVRGIGAVSCDPDTPTEGLPKDFSDSPFGSLAEATPFTVYATYECSPIGRPIAEAKQRATQRLQAREEQGVEKFFWTGSLGNEPNLTNADVDTLGTGLNMVTALGMLEQFAADTWGGPGVIHVPRIGATVLAQNGVIKTQGGQLQTALGSPVVAGTGYPNSDPAGVSAPNGTAWAVVTPPLLVYRSEIFTSSSRDGDLLDRGSNDLYAIAERTYLVGFDTCGVAAVNFNVPQPPAIPTP